jgi:hypothetical protein
MISFFDVFSLGLLVVSLSVFFIRYVKQDPPIMPYLLIAIVCAVGNWLGDSGGGDAALMLLIAASILFLALVLTPYRSKVEELVRGKKSAPSES